MNLKFKPLLFFLVCCISIQSNASHLRGGTIFAKPLSGSSLTYEIHLILYADPEFNSEYPGNGILSFGDGMVSEIVEDPLSIETYGNNITRFTFVFEHTFPGYQTFTISYTESSWIGSEILNTGAASVPFYIENRININLISGLNSTPKAELIPNIIAVSGKNYLFGYGYQDAEGDSISYSIISPQTESGQVLQTYQLPNSPEFYLEENYNTANAENTGPPNLNIDPYTGNIIWDSPGFEGTYEITIQIEEWRWVEDRWLKLSSGTSNLLVQVINADNEPPVVEGPKDSCLLPGESFSHPIQINSDQPVSVQWSAVPLYTISNPYSFGLEPGTEYIPPIEANFNWKTSCSDARNLTYPFYLQTTIIEGDGVAPISTLSTWNITVAGAPENLRSKVPEIGEVELNWSTYYCDIAESIFVYRVPDNFPLFQDECEGGISNSSGASLIATLDANMTSFSDTGLDPSTTYCYRLVANFKETVGGQSIPSKMVCVKPDENSVVTSIDISDVPLAKLFDFYPNPAHDQLHITRKQRSLLPLSIRIMSVNGQLMHQWQMPFFQNHAQLTLIDMVAGVYLIRLQQGNRVENRRLIIRDR